MQKSVFEQFSKEVLISFILQEGMGFRFRDEKRILRALRFIEWERKSLIAQKMMEEACAEQKNETSPTPVFWAAQKKFDKARKLSDEAQKIYDSLDS